MTTPRRLTPEESANAFAEGKRRSDELRQQTAKMRLTPVGTESEIAQRLEAAEAEVASWRRAVRWYTVGNSRAELRVKNINTYTHELGAVSQYTGGWTVEVHGAYKPGIQTDRNAACAKVCELLGIPVVLP